MCTSKSKQPLKILLISMSNVWRSSNVGVDQLAGYLRGKGYHNDIKYYHKRESVEEIANDLPNDYDVYGLSVHSSNYDKCCQVSDYIKKMYSNKYVLFGGAFPTMYFREIFERTDSVDYIILGDGEEPTELLLQHLASGCMEPVVSPSIVTMEDQEHKTPHYNKEILHFPVFDCYENDSLLRNSRKIYCLQTKNNICTGNCSFCTERKGRIYYKDIKQIVDEIAYVANNFGIKKFFITDDNILDPNNDKAKNRMRELCLEIQKLQLNIVFECYIKAISLKDNEKDNDLLRLMSETGFKTIFVGLESGNEHDLVLYNKFTKVSDNYNIIHLLYKHNIVPLIGFINFNPYSTLETIRQNYEFLTNIKLTNLFQYVCSFLRVSKYTALYKKMSADGLITSDFTYLNDLGYVFKNDDVSKVFNFVYEYMYPRVRNLDIELDWMYQYYVECKTLNQKAAKYEKELLAIKEEQFDLIKQFFHKLYVENDLENCKQNVDEFLQYFENLQPRLLEIYDDLVNLYGQVEEKDI